MDVHKGPEGRGSGPCGRMWTGEGVKNVIFLGRHKWMAPLQKIIRTRIQAIVFNDLKKRRFNPEPQETSEFEEWIETGKSLCKFYQQPRKQMKLHDSRHTHKINDIIAPQN